MGVQLTAVDGWCITEKCISVSGEVEHVTQTEHSAHRTVSLNPQESCDCF